MRIKIDGLQVSGCESIVSVPEDADGDVEIRNVVGEVRTVVEIRNRPSLLGQLGLPADTDPNMVASVLRALNEMATPTPAQVQSLVKSSFGERLSNAASLATVTDFLMKLKDSNLTQTAIRVLIGAPS